MKRYRYEIIFTLLSITSGFLAFYVTTFYWIGLGIGFLNLLICVGLISPLFKKKEARKRREVQAFQFINRFSITLNSSKSVEQAYQSALEGIVDPKIREVSARIEGLSILEKVRYYGDYFQVSFYDVFISIYAMYEETGGDFLVIADPLLKEMNQEVDYQNRDQKESLKKLMEFISLWALSCFIVAFLRIGLKSLYPYLVKSPSFLALTILFFVLFTISFLLFSSFYTGEKISFYSRRKKK